MKESRIDLTVAHFKRLNALGQIELVDPSTMQVIKSEHRYDLTTNELPRYNLSPGIISILASLIRDGKTLPQIAKMEGMPTANVLYAWKRESEEFRIALQEAEKDRAEQFHSKIIDVVYQLQSLDKNDVPAMKLMLETLFRLAESDNPDKYKARPGATEVGSGNITIRVDTGIDRNPVEPDIETSDFKEVGDKNEFK